MPGDNDNADAAAARLEAALERIAQLAGRSPDAPHAEHDNPPSADLAARLDTMIARLRAALDGKS
jgi:hypothetical protein